MFDETVDYSCSNKRGWMQQLPVVYLHENAVIERLKPLQMRISSVMRGINAMILTHEVEGINRMKLKPFFVLINYP